MACYSKTGEDRCIKMKKTFSKGWNSSKQPRKQRKYRFHAPLHIRQKLAGSHLSKDLKKKYNTRSVQPKKGDKVKVLRGQFKGKSGKIERIDLKKSKLYINGIELIKKDGTKMMYPINPSNVIVEELNLEDKKRVKSLERNVKNG